MKKSFYLLLFVIIIYIFSNVFAEAQTTFYVSPDGNDNNFGTITQPFATLQKARDVVRTINKNMTNDIIVNIMGGMYQLDSTLTFTRDDSGTNGYNVIFQAYHCETPVISGGIKITGWTLHDSNKNIYKAVVKKSIDSRQLYVNGVRAIRARSIDATGWSEKDDGYDCPSEVKNWKNINNVEVVSYKYWKCHRGKIAFANDTHAVMAQPYWDNLHFQYDAPPVWIENAYELLDTEGEWYLDRSDGTLYYKPRAGENMTNAEVILPKLETLVSGSAVSNVQFKGITFAYATWLLPNTKNGFPVMQADALFKTKYYESTQIPGNIVFDHSSNLLFEGNKFEHLGVTGLQLYLGCQNNKIYNNTFQDISGSGISIGGLWLAGFIPSIYDVTKNNEVDNNMISDIAKEYNGCVGIFVGCTEHTVITHNEIRKIPYTGISVGWGWNSSIVSGRNNVISHNRIDSIMMILYDGGGIYTLSNQPGANVYDNFISNQFNNWGSLYLDQGSCNMHWHHNVLSNIQYWITAVTDIDSVTVDNNYFDNQTSWVVSSTSIFQNNVYVADGKWSLEAQSIMKNAGRNIVNKNIANIIQQPVNTEVCIGESVSLSCGVEGNIYYYQWQKDGIDIQINDNPTAQSSYFTINSSKYEQSGSYRCKIIIEDFCNGNKQIYSDIAVVHIASPTSITVQPKDNILPLGSVAIFAFTANINGKKIEDAIINDEVKVQWYKFESDTKSTLLNDNMPRISGSKSNYLTINNVTKEDFGKYYAQITGLCGVVNTEKAKLFEEKLDITITQQPTVLTNCEVTDAIFNVDATSQSSKVINYQWFKDGTPLFENLPQMEGTNTKHLVLYAVDKNDAGKYSATVSLESTTITKESDKVQLNVKVKPEISTQPQGNTLKVGEDLSVEVALADIKDPTVKYQWFKDSKQISNATVAKYDKVKVTSDDQGQYWCVITNDCGTTTSDKVIVTITTGTTDVTDIQSNGYTLSLPIPSPVNNVANVRYYVPNTANVNITLSNTQGSFKFKLVNQLMFAGEHFVTINSEKLNISSGTYFFKLESDGIVLIQKFMVIK